MAIVKLYDETGDQKAREVQAQIRRNLGFVPEAHQAIGRSGEFLEAFVKLDATAGANLDEPTRHLIAIAVSAVNGCTYCLEAHRAIALKVGCTEEEVTGAIEMAGMMAASNTMFKALKLNHDLNVKTLGVEMEMAAR